MRPILRTVRFLSGDKKKKLVYSTTLHGVNVYYLVEQSKEYDAKKLHLVTPVMEIGDKFRFFPHNYSAMVRMWHVGTLGNQLEAFKQAVSSEPTPRETASEDDLMRRMDKLKDEICGLSYQDLTTKQIRAIFEILGVES